jgi:hypothetical protein
MLQLAAIQTALERGGFEYDAAKKASRIETPQTFLYPGENIKYGEAIRLKHRFKQSGDLRACLNKLEPALGDRFYAAVEKMPPGREQRGRIR